VGSMIHLAIKFHEIVLLFLLVGTVIAAPVPPVTFAVTPAQTLMDDQLRITISGRSCLFRCHRLVCAHGHGN
jgi:hypothetical protein